MEKTPVNTFQTILIFPQLGSGPANLEAAIPGDPSDYIVQQHGAWWMVTRQNSQETIYAGPGPVQVERSTQRV